jgi:hypothetical protein
MCREDLATVNFPNITYGFIGIGVEVSHRHNVSVFLIRHAPSLIAKNSASEHDSYCASSSLEALPAVKNRR